MNIIVKKNGQLVSRFMVDDESVTAADFTIDAIPNANMPKRPLNDAGVGRYWKLDYKDGGIGWFAAERELTQSEMLSQAGGIRTERVQSDKVGFDFVNYYVGETLVRQVYEPQEVPHGTASNPIPYEERLALIVNAHYIRTGEIKVWCGEAGAVAAWDAEGWESMA